ncbi:hypothetical protein ACE5IS_00170 [Leptospira wolffii]|uniref:Lipoprotein n=1 Tax=Leptospira wolffii TaxID=409998 RepID=A0A2M9ZFJ7_9LEPT|nr:hypothetical protein [Leptospira wolffii]PJZ67210.1 hypothetical protein CH371_03905 [Leptospira wolffii]TGK62200.1 hypothetical protein EHQ32_05035 [Leptospira wolffii]TGK66571.1 hypothetical protein EHQ27_16520 [Leptospira wolffii]TGK74416.1 hypothetical protein EHQ35_08740 [Leptospira wolffii]TGL32009.1 hypothetical protein EHQ57_03935 [Leptospira wolffii]
MKIYKLILCLGAFAFLYSCGSDPVKRCQDRRKVMRDAVCQAVAAHEGTDTYNESLMACLYQQTEYSDCNSEGYF